METLEALHAWWHGVWPGVAMPHWLFTATEFLAVAGAVSLLSAIIYALGAREIQQELLIPWTLLSLAVLVPPLAVIFGVLFGIIAVGHLCVAARTGVQHLRNLPRALARQRQRRQAEREAVAEQLERDYQDVVRMIRE